MDILLVHPQFSKIGGAEKVSLKIIELLTSNFDVNLTILSTTDFDVQHIENHSGFSIDTSRINCIIVKIPAFLRYRFFHLKIALLHRKAKQLAPSFSHCISTYNELDFGKPAFQYVHHPMMASDSVLSKKHLARKKPILITVISVFIRKLSHMLAQRNLDTIANNITATNSNFINTIYQEIYTAPSRVIYPSILGELKKADIQKKKQVLCVSRFAPNKNLFGLFKLFNMISQECPGIDFVIAGQIEDEAYFNSIKKIAQNQTYNLTLISNASREEIVTLFRESEYYINPKEYEHFGIAVLEAMNYGCIPFVHNSGGSIELIPINKLRFTNSEHIVKTINSLETSLQDKTELIEKLSLQSKSMSEKRFENEMIDLLKSFIY